MADQDPYASIATAVQAPQPSAPSVQPQPANDPYANIAAPIQIEPSKTPNQNPNEPLGTFGKIFLGPDTASGAPLPESFKEEGSGVSDILHGDVSQGLGKIVHAETPHVISGSPIEKLIQQFKPDFKGSLSPEQTEFQDRQVHAGLNSPLVDVAQTIDKDKHPVLKALTEAAQSMTSPGNVAIMVATGGMGLVESPKALAVANKLLSAGFTAQAVGQAYKNLKSFKEAYDKGDSNDALYQLTHAVTSGTMAYIAGTHAAGKPVTAAEPSTDLGKMAQERVVEPISEGVSKAASGAGEAAANAAGGVVQGVKKGLGIGDDFYTTVKKISPPSKGYAMEYNDTLKTAEPQLREVFRQNPDVQTPKDMYDAMEQHRKQTEARLGAKAVEFKGKPESQMVGIEAQVRDSLNKAFDENPGQYKPEEREKAIQSVMSHLLQEEPGQLEGTKTSREPDLAEAEGVRRRFNDDTESTFGSNAPAVPAAEAFAKKTAANTLRQAIDQKFDDLGVTDVKEWRKQEAALIDVRDQIADAVKKSDEMGTYNVFESLTKQFGWKTLLGFAAGAGGGPETGLAGAFAASGLGAVADYIKDLKLNPNRKVQKAANIANEPGPTGAALPREKPNVNPTQATGGSAPGSIDLETRYELPTEPARKVTERLPDGFFPQDVHTHEWGHTTNAALEGWGTDGIKSHLNESLGPRTVAAATVVPKDIDWKDTESVYRNSGRILSVLLGGAVANELHSGIPFEINNGLAGDLGLIKRTFKKLGFSPDEIESAIKYGRDRATRNLTQPGISDIMLENSKVREPNLNETMHASPERTEAYAEEVRRIQDENRKGKGSDQAGTDRETGRSSGQLDAGGEGEVPSGDSKTDLKLEGLKERTTGDSTADSHIKLAGAIPAGSMMNLVLFHDPKTGSTLALDKSDVTPELVKKHLDESREKFGVKADLDEVVNDAKKSGGGFVADLRTGKSTDNGYLVEMMPEKRVTLDHDATPKDIQKFYNDNRQLFKEHPELRIGGYKNELNISAHTTDQSKAESLAKKLDQRSVWDVKNGQEIKTGGQGKTVKFPNYKFEDRINELRK